MTGWAGTMLMGLLAQGTPQYREGPVPPALHGIEARAVEATAPGVLWFGAGGGLARLEGGEIDWVGVEDGLASAGVADIHQDRLGRLWAAGLGGFSVLEGNRWRASRNVGDLQPRVVFGIFEEEETNAVWLAASGGAGRLEDGRWTLVTEADGLPHQVVHSVVVDRRGAVWLACRRGVAQLAEGGVTVHFPEVNFRSAVVGSDGSVWFGTSDGIYAWDGSSWHVFLRGTTAYARLVATDGTVWAGSADAGIFRGGLAGWESVELPQRFAGAEVFDLAEGSDGSIWFATSVGVGRLVPVR